MGCLSFTLGRVGGVSTSLERVGGGISVNMEMGGGISVGFERIGGIASSLQRVGGVSCRLGLVCKPGIGDKYLEIEPTIIWVYPDWGVDNNVYSNTTWNVD